MKEFKMKINGSEYNVTVESVEGTLAKIEVNGTAYNVEIDKPMRQSNPTPIKISSTPSQVKRVSPAATASKSSAASSAPTEGKVIKSPLPGVIIEVACNVGDEVKSGQKLLVLEAMKMENNINAESDGKVIEIKVQKDDSVLEGADLIVIG